MLQGRRSDSDKTNLSLTEVFDIFTESEQRLCICIYLDNQKTKINALLNMGHGRY